MNSNATFALTETQLTQFLKDAQTLHHAHEASLGHADANWAPWYAEAVGIMARASEPAQTALGKNDWRENEFRGFTLTLTEAELAAMLVRAAEAVKDADWAPAYARLVASAVIGARAAEVGVLDFIGHVDAAPVNVVGPYSLLADGRRAKVNR